MKEANRKTGPRGTETPKTTPGSALVTARDHCTEKNPAQGSFANKSRFEKGVVCAGELSAK